MKIDLFSVSLAVWLVGIAATAVAGVRSGGNYTVNDTTDSGGQRAVSANYVMDGSIGGMSTVVSRPETVKHGYIGQLTELAGFGVTVPSSVNEGATSQLGGLATLDDGTWSLLAGNEVTWLAVTLPLSSVSPIGLLTAGTVYNNTAGTVAGSLAGLIAPASILVLDSSPDNFGTYAGDGLSDSWQVQYYGTNNANAGPLVDLFGTGNNQFKYVVGLNPTNPASVFALKIGGVSNHANWRAVSFSPRWLDRTYWVECRTNLMMGGFGSLGSSSTSDNGTERTVTDQDANMPRKFYRVQISYP